MRTGTMLTFILTGLLAAAALPARSDDRNAAYERRIDEMQRQMDALQRELEALRAEFGSQGAASPEAAQESAPGSETMIPYVRRKSENVEVTFSGRVHRMLLTVDDGANTDLFFTDSEQGPTMLRFDAAGKVSEGFSIGASLETGIRQNRPFLVSQDKPEADPSVTVRIAEAWFQHHRVGRLSLGRGFAAGWLAPEVDLSGTQFASLLPVGMLAPGMKFVNATDNSLSNIQVLEHFVDVERLLASDRARYDSPRFGPGLQVSGTVASDGRWDTALRAKPKQLGDWTLVGGASYQNKPFMGIDRRQDAAVSVRHEPTGLNLTLGGSRERLDDGRDANTYLIKFGWLAKLFSLGPTAFSADYYTAEDLRLQGDQADSVGFFAVQKWPRYGLDLYAGYRRYDVSRPDIQLKSLDVYVLGVGFSF